MTPIHPDRIRRILIRSANWVGDAIMSTPMIRAIRRHFQKARIVALAKPWVAPVFECSPDMDDILIYDAGGRHRGAPGMIRLIGDIRAGRYDLAVLVQNAFEAAFLTAAAGIPLRLGYATDGRSLLLTHAVPMTRSLKRRHQIDYYLGVLEGAGIPPAGRRMTVHISRGERIRADAHRKGPGLRLGINPGAAYGTAKRWPSDRFADVCDRLAAIFPGLSVLVFGGPGEEGLGEAIRNRMTCPCVSLAGKTSLRQALALIETLDLFVTNDSGLMHAAAALEVPQVAIFGPTDYRTTFPAGVNRVMVRSEVPCSPCLMPECPLGHHRCMNRVSVDEVCAAAVRILRFLRTDRP